MGDLPSAEEETEKLPAAPLAGERRGLLSYQVKHLVHR